MKMERAFIEEERQSATCCWSAPNKESLAALFDKAGVRPERISTVEEIV